MWKSNGMGGDFWLVWRYDKIGVFLLLYSVSEENYVFAFC